MLSTRIAWKAGFSSVKVPLWLSEYYMYLVALLYSVSATNKKIWKSEVLSIEVIESKSEEVQ